MTQKYKQTVLGFTIAFFSFFAFAGFHSAHLESHEPTEFLILIQKTETGLSLKCESGCYWKDLSFSLKQGEYQMVDQNGMTTKNQHDLTAGDRNSRFLFNIRHTANGIELKGMHGTHWNTLTFSCAENDCHQYIDQHGMANGEKF